MIAVPETFRQMPRWWHDRAGREWLDQLPTLVTELCRRWNLQVDGDPLQLGRALTNVIGNAVKFSRAGGSVSVHAVVEATRVRIQCRDEGIGIPEADMQQMFSRFVRASTATARALPGTGLGLAIVKAIVDAHHGELELHSVEGEGTTVVMVLPLTPRDVAAKAPAPGSLGTEEGP